MTGSDAFLSFAHFVKSRLKTIDSPIMVIIERHTNEPPPYLVLQEGPETISSRWLSQVLAQGKLIVGKLDLEPMKVTAAKRLKEVLHITRDPGFIGKYDYSANPSKLVGSIIVENFELTEDFSHNDLRSYRIVTWVLNSNTTVKF
jgi:hypothetical protein